MSNVSIVRRGRVAWGQYALAGVLLALLAVFLLYPVLGIVQSAFWDENGRVTGLWFKSVATDATFLGKLGNSLLLAVVVTVLANAVAMPLAILQGKYQFPLKRWLGALVLVPMILPPFVGAVAIGQLLRKFGALTILLQHLHILGKTQGVNWLDLGGFWAVAGLITLGLYPISYLNLQAALANIDPAMLEAAQNLGGSKWTNFRRITLPLAMPGIFAGSTIVFIWAFTELGTPLLLNYPNVVSRSIFDEVNTASAGQGSVAFARVAVVLAISAGVYLAGKFLFGRWGGAGLAMTSKAATAAAGKRLRGVKGWLAALPFVVVTGVALLPHLGVVAYSVTAMASEPAAFGWGPAGTHGWDHTVVPSRYTFEGYHALVTDATLYGSVVNSLKYASVSTAIDLVLGVALAWVIVRSSVRFKWGLDALAMLPLAVPGLVMAFGFIAMSHKAGFGWMSTAGEASPFAILAIAYAVRRLPYLVRSAAGGLQQTSVSLEEAAANLGASRGTVLWKVTLPLIMANLIAGALLTFSFAMLEVSDSIILAPLEKDYPITKKIYALGTDASVPENVRNACALGVLAMVLLAGTLVAANVLLGKRLGALFRA